MLKSPSLSLSHSLSHSLSISVSRSLYLCLSLSLSFCCHSLPIISSGDTTGLFSLSLCCHSLPLPIISLSLPTNHIEWRHHRSLLILSLSVVHTLSLPTDHIERRHDGSAREQVRVVAALAQLHQHVHHAQKVVGRQRTLRRGTRQEVFVQLPLPFRQTALDRVFVPGKCKCKCACVCRVCVCVCVCC